jgi:uncharacterized membrane protein
MTHTTTYNRVAGQSLERLAALSDGIFGVAMTLLLLDLHVPEKIPGMTPSDLRWALWKLAPNVLVYMLSFMILGIFWVGQQTQLNHLSHSERHLTWLHLAFLFPVTTMPFSTRLLVSFINFRVALLIYWANILVLGILVYCCWIRALRAGMVRENVSQAARDAICKRIVYAQILYAISVSLCVFSNYLAICAIVLVQLYFVLAPERNLAAPPSRSGVIIAKNSENSYRHRWGPMHSDEKQKLNAFRPRISRMTRIRRESIQVSRDHEFSENEF